MAQAQGVPGEPMPMNVAPGAGMSGGPMPMFGTGYGPGMPQGGMPGGQMMPMGAGPMMQGMPGMPGMPPGMGDPGIGMGGMPGMPDGPSMNFGECGPNGVPGVGLPMGATYYPGISGVNKGSIWDWLFLTEEGDKRKFYAKIGYIGLQRTGVRGFPLVSQEPLANNIDGLGDSTFGLTPFIANFNSPGTVINNGVQAYIGLQDDCKNMMFEIGGFFTENRPTQQTYISLGRLDSPYVNAPVGFQDNQGLWTNADLMRLTYKNSIYSGEANLRFFGTCWKTLDVNYLIGLRYIKLQDSMQHYTIDDDLQLGINDPTTRATLGWAGSNDMLGAQIGWSITQRLNPTWSISWDQKIAFLCNNATTTQTLVRDDGFVGYEVSKSSRRLANAFETGLFLDMSAGNMRLRGGYTMNIYTGVATADGQFNYDLQVAPTQRKTTDTAVYVGPSASIEIVW